MDVLQSLQGRGIRIGIIDSGWDFSIPAHQIAEGISFVHPSDELRVLENTDVQDQIGHGTACTDLIMQIAPDAVLYPIRVFGQQLETSVPILCAAIKWATEKQLQILNISLGTLLTDALHPLYAACELAHRKGLIVVAATNHKYKWSYPAIFDNVIGVGMGDVNHTFEYRYCAGEAVECLAKAHHQNVQWLKGIRRDISGTSFAAPIITGILALYLEQYPTACLEEIRYFLREYASR